MGKRFVSIWFPHLATDWFTLRNPKLKSMPFVLTQSSHGRLIITAANAAAQKGGVYIGMVVADARAIISNLQVFDDKPGLTTQLCQRIAEWCIRFTPFAAPDGCDGVTLDASGCIHLWGSDKEYLEDILKRINVKGYAARAAIADTIGAAWAIARFKNGEFIIESGKQTEAVLSLPAAALRLPVDVTSQLNKLGLRLIRDFIAIPSASLRRRFGIGIVQRIAQTTGAVEEGIQPVYAVEPYSERLPCLEPIITRTGIEMALTMLLKQLCSHLKSDGKGLRSAYLRCYKMDGGAQGIEISTNKPSHHIEHLYRLFEIKLSSIEPGLGIELFQLEATKVEDAPSQQEAFWKEGGGLNDQKLSELIDRLCSKLGKESVSRYLPVEHHWPERSVKSTASLDEQPETIWPLDKRRPLHLLPKPEMIDVTAPIPDYPPMNFRYKGLLHTVTKADGPERIEQEWWTSEGEHRDYYCVEDEKGCRYWLFRLGHYSEEKRPQWFLHGFFA